MAYPDLAAQIERMKQCGYEKADALDMNAVQRKLLAPEENARIARLEILDEFEELFLLQAHYCVVLGTHDAHSDGFWDRVTLSHQ